MGPKAGSPQRQSTGPAGIDPGLDVSCKARPGLATRPTTRGRGGGEGRGATMGEGGALKAPLLSSSVSPSNISKRSGSSKHDPLGSASLEADPWRVARRDGAVGALGSTGESDGPGQTLAFSGRPWVGFLNARLENALLTALGVLGHSRSQSKSNSHSNLPSAMSAWRLRPWTSL